MEHGWERDERINERDTEERELTVASLYNVYGEPISDEEWDKRLNEENS